MGVLSQHALQVVSQHALQQGGSALGVWRSPPESRRLLLRAVRILLECILVFNNRVVLILYLIPLIRRIQLEPAKHDSTLHITESFSMSPSHSWLFGIVVMMAD